MQLHNLHCNHDGLSDETIMIHGRRLWYGTIISYFTFNSIFQFTGTFHYERHDNVLKFNGSTRNPTFEKDADYLLHMLLRISEEKKVGRDFGPRNGRMVGKPKLHLFNEVSINVLI